VKGQCNATGKHESRQRWRKPQTVGTFPKLEKRDRRGRKEKTRLAPTSETGSSRGTSTASQPRGGNKA